MRPVLCIRHHQPHELGVAGEVFGDARVPHRYLDVWQDGSWPALEDLSGLVVLGGEMHAEEDERYPFLARERQMLREAAERNVPVMGICLGAQLLARALGAAVLPSPVPELGFLPLTPTPDASADPVLAPFADAERVFQWHVDTFDLPEGATLLYSSPSVPHQAFRIGRAAYGVQFHPEATERGIAAWVETFADAVRDLGRTPRDLLAEMREHLPAQEKAARQAFREFAGLLRG